MIDTYFNGIIVKNKDKILANPRMKYEIEQSIATLVNFESYVERIKTEEDKSNKDKVIKDMLCYLSHQVEDFVSCLVVDNFQSIMVMQRVLLEMYFRLLFIINGDEYIATLFLDFKNITMYNFIQLGDNKEQIDNKNMNTVLNDYRNILNKYGLSEDKKYSDDFWISLSLKHLNHSHPDKSLKHLLEYLIDKDYVEDFFEAEYKNCCDFIHSNHNGMDLTIYDNIYSEEVVVHSAIRDFHYILYSILDNIENKINSNFDIVNYKSTIKKNLENILNKNSKNQ